MVRLGFASTLVGIVAALILTCVQAQNPPATANTFRESFERPGAVWRAGVADSSYREISQTVDNKVSHTGQSSVHLRLTANPGTHIYYWYPIPRVDLVDNLKVSIWVKANRPGTRIVARAVLPKERQAKNLDQPITEILTGDVYQASGQWQQLWLREPKRALQSQTVLLQGELNRQVNLEGAYLDQIQLNVYSGPGDHDIWIDDLEISPVLGGAVNEIAKPANIEKTPATRPAPVVELARNKLMVDKQAFFLRGIRYTDQASLPIQRELGFNTLWVDGKTPQDAVAMAAREGFWLIPEIRPSSGGMNALTTSFIRGEMDHFPRTDQVLAWQIVGDGGLTAETADAVTKSLRASRTQGQLYAGSVWNGYRQYSQNLELVGVHRWPLFTSLNSLEYREWLVSRTRLADPDAFFWTWIQTHVPEQTRIMLTGVEKSANLPDMGPEPGQIRLLSFLALSAGYRGLAFWADSTLNEEHLGKARRLELALLNQQFNLVEPYLASVQDVRWVSTYDSRIQAAILRCDGGILVLPIWIGDGTQCVPGACSRKQLSLIIPGVPIDSQVYEVAPGDLRALYHRRVAGGIHVVVPEFSLCTALLCTNDAAAIGKIQQKAQQMAKNAAQWAYDATREELDSVEKIHEQLKTIGLDRPYDLQLREDAYKELQEAYQAFNRGNLADYHLAYQACQRSSQNMRQLMRNHWDYTVKGLDSPVSSPFAVSYFSLPQHWKWLEALKTQQLTGNLLHDGDCETQPGATPTGWTIKRDTLDEVQLGEGRVAIEPHDGKQCWRMVIAPKDPVFAPEALERTYLVITTPNINLPANTMVRLSGWYRIPTALKASADGLLVYDSAGGEALGLRLYSAPSWKQFTLYRKVPSSGQINLSLALTGIGTIYFDDLKVEALQPAATTNPAMANNQGK
jgi:hypothetical protein